MIPGLDMLRGYRRAWLPGDLLAGVTVAAYLVPQVMAYATIAGLPPVTGLWAAFPALIAYALFGSSKSLSMGPEATTALMTLVAIKSLAARGPGRVRQTRHYARPAHRPDGAGGLAAPAGLLRGPAVAARAGRLPGGSGPDHDRRSAPARDRGPGPRSGVLCPGRLVRPRAGPGKAGRPCGLHGRPGVPPAAAVALAPPAGAAAGGAARHRRGGGTAPGRSQ